MENGFRFTDILKVREILTNRNGIRIFQLGTEEGGISGLFVSKDKECTAKWNIAFCSCQGGQLCHPI